MSKSSITTDDLPPNPAPGEGLREDLFDGLGVSVAEVAAATNLDPTAIDGFLDGTRRVDADLDIRLTRYFGFSEGYLLRLQNAFDLDEVRRSMGPALAAIQPRIARAA